jgi:hypothetical protein
MMRETIKIDKNKVCGWMRSEERLIGPLIFSFMLFYSVKCLSASIVPTPFCPPK